jgi:hypothetical protein
MSLYLRVLCLTVGLLLWRRSVLLVEETGVPGENHQPVAGH